MAGEWLKAKTSTGRVSQRVPRKLLASGIWPSEEVFQCGMR